MTLRRALFAAVLALVVLAGGTAAGAEPSATGLEGHGEPASTAAKPRRPPPPLRLRQSCFRKSDRATIVRFRASDGVRLIGGTIGRGPHVVVLAHERGRTHCSWLPYARTLARRGYRVLVFNARGHGSSSTPYDLRRIYRIDYDVIGAVREMRRRGASTVVLAGGSMGASAVLVAAAAIRPLVNGVAPVSGGSWRDMDGVSAAQRLSVPVLFLSAEQDGGLPDLHRRLYDLVPPADKRLLILPGSEHGSPLIDRVPEARAALDAFVDRVSGR